MATPTDHLSRSETSIPDGADISSDNIETNIPATPPMPYKGDNYYNFPTQGVSTKPELSSSTTNISMQPNPLYQDFPPGVPQRPTSQKQIVVEKIKEGNPDALSSSATLVNNVKIYERLESLLPSRLSLSPRYSYSPQKETARDSVYQYLGSLRGDTNEALEGLPVSKYNSVTRVGLQVFFSVLLVLTLFIAVVALVIAILSVSVSNSQLTASRDVSRMLAELTPLINANSTYGALVRNITDTQHELNALRIETAHSLAVLTSANNCTTRTTQCLLVSAAKSCGTNSLSVSVMERLTGMACVTTDENGEAHIVHNNSTGEYSCYCTIPIGQTAVWSCNLSLWVCQVV